MNKKAIHAGPLGQLKPIEDTLLLLIFGLRDQGMEVSTLMIIIKALVLSADFTTKSRDAKYSAVRQFVCPFTGASNGYAQITAVVRGGG